MQNPVKSSSEILSELFGAFNAKPPEIVEPIPVGNSLEKSSSDNDDKSVEKEKKRNKHHKSKKSKKSSRHLSDNDQKRKKRKKKDEKHRRKSKHHKSKTKTKENLNLKSSTSSDSEKSDKSITIIDLCGDDDEKSTNEKIASKSSTLNELPPAIPTFSAVDLSDIEPPKGDPLKPNEPKLNKTEHNTCNESQIVANNDSIVTGKSEKIESESNNENCNTTSKVEDVFVECEKPKPVLGGKIMIKNLKFSSVFEETVKQVEEQARLKAERYEEGEISDSSNSRSETKSTSPVPSLEFDAVVKTQSTESSSHSKHSSSKKEHKRSRSSDKRKHKRSGSRSSSHKSRRDKKSSSHRSRSRSKSRLRDKERHSLKGKDHPHTSKDKDPKKATTKRRLSSERSDVSHHHHHRHHGHHSRKESDHHHRSSDHDRHKDPDSGKQSRKRSSSPARKKPYRSRSRSRSKATSPRRKERRSSQEKIDKQKLLEIARKNALSMLKQAPQVVGSEPAKATIAAGGKTVDELTDFCKLLSKKDAEGHESISSNTSDSDASESEKPFHHPFQIKDRPSSIVLNIRNAVPMPLKTLQEKTAEQSKVLSQQFPVSSGQLHRKKESDWVPVSPKKETENIPLPALPAPDTNKSSSPSSSSSFVPPLPPPPLQPPPLPPDSILFDTKPVTEPTPQVIDVSTIMTQRLAAMRQLEKNPRDVHARNQINKAEMRMQAWAESKYEPGQFTGSTGARILTPYELAPGSQAWTRPVSVSTTPLVCPA